MAARRIARTKQPQGLVGVAQSPSNRGLLFAQSYNNASGFESVSGKFYPWNVVPSIAAWPLGIATTGSEYVVVPAAFIASGADYTCRMVFSPSSLGGERCLILSPGGGLYIRPSGLIQWYNAGFQVGTVTPLVADAVCDVFIHSLGGVNSIFINSAAPDATGLVFDPAAFSTAPRLWADGSSQNFQGRKGLFEFWNRGLLVAEIAGRLQNKWAGFQPLQRRIWVGVTAGGGSTGTVAKTNANDTSAASGTTTILGTLAKTNANDTLSASGTTTVTGALAKTNANDSVVASGSTGQATGTVAYTNANDTSTASGTTTVAGTLARTNANDTCVASGVAQSAVTVPDGSKARGRAKRKRIEAEQRIEREYLESLKPPPPVAKKRAPIVKAETAVDVVKPAPSVARVSAVEQASAIAAPVERDLAAEVDFKMQYWSRFLVLVIDNLHSH